MVEALADELPQLTVGVLPFLPGDFIDKRYLRPDDKAQRVAFRVDVVRLLVVGQTHSGGADVHDHGQVRVMLLLGECAAGAEPVLMAADPVHGPALPVEVESLPGHYLELPHSQRLHHLVYDAAVPPYPR